MSTVSVVTVHRSIYHNTRSGLISNQRYEATRLPDGTAYISLIVTHALRGKRLSCERYAMGGKTPAPSLRDCQRVARDYDKVFYRHTINHNPDWVRVF